MKNMLWKLQRIDLKAPVDRILDLVLGGGVSPAMTAKAKYHLRETDNARTS